MRIFVWNTRIFAGMLRILGKNTHTFAEMLRIIAKNTRIFGKMLRTILFFIQSHRLFRKIFCSFRR